MSHSMSYQKWTTQNIYLQNKMSYEYKAYL